MKAVLFTKPKELQIKDIVILVIPCDEVLVRNKSVGFCGTDFIFLTETFYLNIL